MISSGKIKSVDFYRKIPRDLTEASLSGAGLSIVAALAMMFLFGMELNNYMTFSTSTSVIVDQSTDGDFLRIEFNISFPALSCEFASLDISDVLGTNRLNITKTIRKFSIGPDLRPTGSEFQSGPALHNIKHGDEGDEYSGDGSISLTAHNFEKFSHHHPILVVNFYAPWCYWSNRLKPSWEKAAKIMRERYDPEIDGRILLAKVDCTQEADLCRRNHIQGYPSIRIFRRGSDLRMSTSAASTEPSVDSNMEENLSAPLWKYVTKDIVVDADGVARAGGGNVSFTCSFCEKRFNGSHSRVEAHLLKIPRKGIKPCTKVTQAKMQEMQQLLDWCAQQLRERAPNKVPLPPSSSFSGSGSSYFPLMERDDEAKKRRVSPQLAKAFKIEDRQQCDAEIARLFYSSGLSFNVARNPLYRSSYTRASNIPGYVPPGYNALRTTLLDNERRHVERTLEPVKKTWKETGVSLCSDGWTDGQKRPLINMMAAATNKAMMLRAVNCDGTTKDKTEISKLLLASINEIGSENVVQVVTDNAPVCAAAGAMVEEAHPHIFWTPCVVHTLNLVLKDTLKAKAYLPGENVEKELGWLMDVCNDVWFIKNFIVNHNMRLSMYNDNCALKLLQVAETRFASHYVMLKRFRDVKNGMQQMVISPRWDMYREDDVKKARAVKEMLLSDTLWEQIDFMIAFMSPIYEMIRMADLDKPCLHLVYEWWDTMIEKVKKAIYTPEFANVLSIHCDASRFYDVVYSTLIARWTKSSTSLHCMAHSLNPKYYSSQWLEEDPNRVAPHRDTELTNERRRCLIKLYPDPQVRNKVMEEYGYFSLNMGDYSRPDALENKFYFEPLIWWASYGASTPRLQSLAFRLLNQPCSSSCCERNWSTYSFIQGLKRNKLEPKRAQDLVYVHTNLRLLARAEPTYYKDRDSMWDLTGDGHESMEPGINDDVLELAELSLDEPTLERMLVNDEMDY